MQRQAQPQRLRMAALSRTESPTGLSSALGAPVLGHSELTRLYITHEWLR